MDRDISEIVILRPTLVFLSFLASQLPENDVPSLKTLQTNNTAYGIRRYQETEDTLHELERFYSKMFRHEIGRWLGKEARNPIEHCFFDFLCCFKLEFHSHLMLLEPSLKTGHYVLQLKPRMPLIDWKEEQQTNIIESFITASIIENATVVIKHFNSLTEIKPFLNKYYKNIFATAMSRVSLQRDQWPIIHSFQEFKRFFSIEIHTQLISYVS